MTRQLYFDYSESVSHSYSWWYAGNLFLIPKADIITVLIVHFNWYCHRVPMATSPHVVRISKHSAEWVWKHHCVSLSLLRARQDTVCILRMLSIQIWSLFNDMTVTYRYPVHWPVWRDVLQNQSKVTADNTAYQSNSFTIRPAEILPHLGLEHSWHNVDIIDDKIEWELAR